MKGILFDMDGTLLDSMKIWVSLSDRYLESLHVEIPENLHEEIKTMTLKEALAHFKETFRLEDDVEDMLKATHTILAREYRDTVVKKLGVDELLTRLKQRGHRMAVSTATNDDLAEPALRHHGLMQYFEFLQTAKNTGISKNDPAFWEEGARRLQMAPEDIVVFEDALHAVRSAKKAGMRVIALADEVMKKDEEALKEEADVFLPDFSAFEPAMLEDPDA